MIGFNFRSAPLARLSSKAMPAYFGYPIGCFRLIDVEWASHQQPAAAGQNFFFFCNNREFSQIFVSLSPLLLLVFSSLFYLFLLFCTCFFSLSPLCFSFHALDEKTSSSTKTLVQFFKFGRWFDARHANAGWVGSRTQIDSMSIIVHTRLGSME